MTKFTVNEKYPDANTLMVKNLSQGDMFTTNNSDNIYLVCASLCSGNDEIDGFYVVYVNIRTGKICQLHEDTKVFPIDVNITYTKHYYN